MTNLSTDFSDARILIVDDQEANVEVLRGLLEIKGYTSIYHTTDARQVLTLVEKHEPDLLLLDLMMPHLSGFEVMAQLRNANKMSGLMPIMVLTADVNDLSKERALREGAQDFLTKPFAFFEVDLRIRNLLFTARLLRELSRKNAQLEVKVEKGSEALQRAQTEVLESETKYRTLFESNLDGITICAVDEGHQISKIIDCNEGALQMYGYEREELMAMHMGSIELSDDKQHAVKIEKLKRTGSLTYETSYRNKAGQERFMEAKVVRIELEGRVYAMHIASDITERRAHLEALEKQNASLKEIAWQQSHNFRAPLARILSLVDLINQENKTDDVELIHLLEALRLSAYELDDVIHHITRLVEQSKFDSKSPEQ